MALDCDTSGRGFDSWTRQGQRAVLSTLPTLVQILPTPVQILPTVVQILPTLVQTLPTVVQILPTLAQTLPTLVQTVSPSWAQHAMRSLHTLKIPCPPFHKRKQTAGSMEAHE